MKKSIIISILLVASITGAAKTFVQREGIANPGGETREGIVNTGGERGTELQVARKEKGSGDMRRDRREELLSLRRARNERTVRGERRTKAGQERCPGGDYYVGERHQLVVLAAFADQDFAGDKEATIAQWDKIFNTQGLAEVPFTGSVHDYFHDQSYGLFNLLFDFEYVRVGSPRSKYRSTDTDDENSQYLVNELVDSLLHRSIPWSRYDWNGDGYVNQLLIIYAGKGSSYGGMGGGYDAIWPHQWWLSEHSKDRKQGVFCEPRAVSDGGRGLLVDCYCALQELDKNGSYGVFGTICHEYSHCFGFPDFYSYESVVTPDKWELMDYGAYNGEGYCPPGYSAHERWLMGWLEPTELLSPVRITNMPALGDEPVAYLVRNDGYESEYYMIEYRAKRGWDCSLPGEGVLIFHIDYAPVLWLGGGVNTNTAQHYMLFCANNTVKNSQQSGWAYPYGENASLTDRTAPSAVLWHSSPSGVMLMSKPVTHISVADGAASFDFMNGGEHSVEAVRPEPRNSSKAVKQLINGELYIRAGECLYTPIGIPIH